MCASASYVGPQIGFSWIVREPRELTSARRNRLDPRRASARRMIDDLGLSSRDRSGTVTGGARADRAWDKLPWACVCQHSARCPGVNIVRGRLHREENGGMLVRERAAPWFVKPRRVSGESLRSRCGNAARAGVEATAPPGKSHRRGGRGPNPARRSPPSSARAGRVTSTISTGIREVRGCARGLF